MLLYIPKYVLSISFWISVVNTTEVPKDPGLIKEVNPDLTKVKGLICYQCHSNTSETVPLCDTAMFKLSQPKEKEQMSFQCPYYQKAYCFTHIIYHDHITETIRGCTADADANGNKFKSGCARMKTQDVCLCNENFCNGDSGLPIMNCLFSFIISLAMYLVFK